MDLTNLRVFVKGADERWHLDPQCGAIAGGYRGLQRRRPCKICVAGPLREVRHLTVFISRAGACWHLDPECEAIRGPGCMRKLSCRHCVP